MKRVAIMGRGVKWEKGYDDPGEKWLVSSAYFRKPGPADKIFQLHDRPAWEPELLSVRDKLVLAWHYPMFDFCEMLPHEKLIAEFGPVFSSSISWMLAYALYLGYDEIALYGVDMIADAEYGDQRDYLFYLLGVAAARGVRVETQEYAGIHMVPVTYGVPEL